MEFAMQYDVIIIGGSYAGLSAAMALGRSLKNVLVIDSGKPCNAPTPHSHNFLTQDGATPAAIATLGKQQVQQYDTVAFYNGLATEGKATHTGFDIITAAGDIFTAKKLIFATGIKDTFPDIKGFEEAWGKSVIHCPYCHGYEFRDKRTGIMANGEMAFHLAALVNNLSPNITVFTNGPADFKPEQVDKLNAHNIPVITTLITAITQENGNIAAVTLADNTTIELDALYARVLFEQHCPIPVHLGCELNELGYIQVDNMYRTTVPCIFACGDNSNFMRSVANAVAAGNFTGAAVNRELTEQGF
jgi:thioredoxin reductase